MFKKKEYELGKAEIGNCPICEEVADFFANNGIDINKFLDSFYTIILDRDSFYKKCGSMEFLGNSNDVYEKDLVFNNPIAFDNLIGVHTYISRCIFTIRKRVILKYIWII